MPARAILMLFAFACPTLAGVVSRDLFAPGDGLLTYDDVNQREWLDLAATDGDSEERLEERISGGGDLYGFTYATRGEVYQFASAFRVESIILTTGDIDLVHLNLTLLPQANPVADHLADALSVPFILDMTGNEVRSSLGLTKFDGTVDGLDFRRVAVVASRPNAATGAAIVFASLYRNVSLGNVGQRGYWLYRDVAPVPEPTAATLMVTACLAALSLRVRHSHDSRRWLSEKALYAVLAGRVILSICSARSRSPGISPRRLGISCGSCSTCAATLLASC
jgi:hypothetical protein